MAAPSKDTPQLLKVQQIILLLQINRITYSDSQLKIREKLQSKLPTDAEASSRITWAGFLVQEGANTDIKNKKGRSPLQTCEKQYAEAIMQLKATKGYVNMYGYWANLSIPQNLL